MPPFKNIRDFFKPFAIPKQDIPAQDNIEDEIVVAAPKPITRTLKPDAITSQKETRIAAADLLSQHDGQQQHSPPPSISPRLSLALDDETAPTSSLTTLASSQSTTATTHDLPIVDIPHQQQITVTASSAPAPHANASTSFSSFTAISSSSSSRRIVENGIKAVTNSDSDSQSTSSDDGLLDPADLLPRKKRKITPPAVELASTRELRGTDSERSRPNTRLRGGIARGKNHNRSPSPPPRITYKHSLAKLVRQRERHDASEAKIREAEEFVEEQRLIREAEVRNAQTVDEDGVALATDLMGDEAESDRMRAAIQRTEALNQDEVFYFFHGPNQEPDQTQFPEEALGPNLRFLIDGGHRHEAFLSGFVADVAEQVGLPDPILLWTYSALLSETSEQLCHAYVAVIEAASRKSIPFALMKTCLLSKTYPERTCLQLDDNKLSGRGAFPIPSNLKYVLQIASILAFEMKSIEQRASAIVELVFLNVDEHVRTTMDLQCSVEEALNALLHHGDSPDDIDAVLQPVIGKILDQGRLSRKILCRAISSLPATSPRLHRFRRLLALHYTLDADVGELVDPLSPDTGTRVLVKLKHDPLFAISETTDWILLLSTIPVLDIAIAGGFSDLSLLDISAQITKSGVFSAEDSSESTAEAAFNSQVDGLVTRLRLIANNIRDAGTSHLRRTEAKSALDRLCARLEHTVRTKPKPRKGVFGGFMGASEQGFLRGFLATGTSSGEDKKEETSVAKEQSAKADLSSLV